MGYLMARSFAECMGITWPRDVAAVVDGRPVTWAEVHAARRKDQERRLANIRLAELPAISPAYVWTFFNSQAIPYHGWYCYVVTRYERVAVNFRGFETSLARSIMLAIPLGMLPLVENFEAWMEELSRQHPRQKLRTDRRKAGSAVGWYDRKRKQFTLTKPSKNEH